MASSKTLFACLAFVLFSFCEAREFLVGDKKGSWHVPSTPDEFNEWAEKKRFEIGDSIVFKYDGKTDSVLELKEEDYKTCNKSKPVKSYNDGNTKIVLDGSGPFFFISGAEGHCEKGEKLEIKVLSKKHHHARVAPAPSPAEHHHHAPAPAPKRSDGGSGMKVGFMFGFVVAGISALALL